jgi:DNA (cytosine-5)-methyltransferase 1
MSVSCAAMERITVTTAARKRRKPPQKTFCEFFAGIGLVREGLSASGWSCIYANDIDPKKKALYETRFGPSADFHLGDVWETAEVLTRISGRAFLATASFPCVDLSLAGHYKGIDGNHSSSFFGFAKVLVALHGERPPVVMLENVSGFISSRHGQDFTRVVRTLADFGYWIDAFVLDAKHFVPQSRPRVFVVGIKDGFVPRGALRQQKSEWMADPWRTRLAHGGRLRPSKLVALMESVDLVTGWVLLDLPSPPSRVANLADVIALDENQTWWDEAAVAKHYRMMSDLHRRQVDRLLASGTQQVGTVFRRVRNGSCRAEARFDGLAGCLRTPRGGSAKQIVIVLDRGTLRMRWMSPLEYARLQGAGDFPLKGDPIQLLFGFGDAVCVPVIRWIDQHVLTPIFESAAASHGTVLG